MEEKGLTCTRAALPFSPLSGLDDSLKTCEIRESSSAAVRSSSAGYMFSCAYMQDPLELQGTCK